MVTIITTLELINHQQYISDVKKARFEIDQLIAIKCYERVYFQTPT